MKKQESFASAAWNRKHKVTRREHSLAEMDAVIPWPRLLAMTEPYYHRGSTGRQPHDLERMLRIYFMQQWFNLSDPQAEDAIYDSESTRRFARVELGDDKVPDESTILRFRHPLETRRLTEDIFEAVKDLLAGHREEPGLGLNDVCPGESLRRKAPATTTGGGVRPAIDPALRTAPPAPGKGAKRTFNPTTRSACGRFGAACAELSQVSIPAGHRECAVIEATTADEADARSSARVFCRFQTPSSRRLR